MKKHRKTAYSGFVFARMICAGLLLWALARHPYGYYTLLRFVVCGVTAYGVFHAITYEKFAWAWIFGLVALLFNPIIPFHLDRGTWTIIDVAIAIFLLVSILLVGKPKSEKADTINGNEDR